MGTPDYVYVSMYSILKPLFFGQCQAAGSGRSFFTFMVPEAPQAILSNIFVSISVLLLCVN